MRGLLVVPASVGAGGSVWLATAGESSFAPRSGEQLDVELESMPRRTEGDELRRAARLLGVQPDAPGHVVDAALAAQLQVQPAQRHPKLRMT